MSGLIYNILVVWPIMYDGLSFCFCLYSSLEASAKAKAGEAGRKATIEHFGKWLRSAHETHVDSSVGHSMENEFVNTGHWHIVHRMCHIQCLKMCLMGCLSKCSIRVLLGGSCSGPIFIRFWAKFGGVCVLFTVSCDCMIICLIMCYCVRLEYVMHY
jgi:hypothetical protein